MNDERFFDLAMKVIGHQSTDAERAELNSLVASRPELKAELEKLQADSRLAREVLPLVAATESSAGEFPAYARERLQTKVRETFRAQQASERTPRWNWRWALGLASAAAIVLLTLPLLKPAAPAIQVAMLDVAGATRGADTNEVAQFQQRWKNSSVQQFAKAAELKSWEENWPSDTMAPITKIVYDRAAGEVRVVGRWKGKPFGKAFLVERNLAATLIQVDGFVRLQTQRETQR